MSKDTLFFDIETMGLDPKHHRFMLASFAFETGKPSSIIASTEDKEYNALVETRRVLEDPPMTVGYNSVYFDLYFLNKRLSMYGERKIEVKGHRDMKASFGHKSLETVARELGVSDEKLEDAPKKTKIDWDIWNKADVGDEEALEYVRYHCEQDVLLLRGIAFRNATKVCSKCGIEKPIMQFHRNGKSGAYSSCADCKKMASSEYRRLNRDAILARSNERFSELRNQAIDFMGGECASCGVSNKVVLQISHRDDDGNIDRLVGGYGKQLYVRILGGQRQLDDLELLCANCHLLRGHNG